ncbi:MAG: hypothetical protein IT308_00085 [Anaerolineaceae bacterium]|nr:hypothetical protein [Anaerolineaceae bacterium]
MKKLLCKVMAGVFKRWLERMDVVEALEKSKEYKRRRRQKLKVPQQTNRRSPP